MIIDNALQNYLFQMKVTDDNENYETLMLMLFNYKFIEAIHNCIYAATDLSSYKKTDKLKMSIDLPSDLHTNYLQAIKIVLNSKFIKENFSEYEIIRKKYILENLLEELLFSIIFSNNNDMYINMSGWKTKYPTIRFESIKEKNELQITFHKDTPISEIEDFLRERLRLKNKGVKRKKSLGKLFRIKNIHEKVRANKDKIDIPYSYLEEVTAKEYSKKFNNKITFEDVKKSLSRVNKIIKDINTD